MIRVGNEEYARANQLVRPDHAARPPRRSSRRSTLRFQLPRQERQGARDRRVVDRAAGEDRQGVPGHSRAGSVPVRRRGGPAGRTSARPTSTTTCARSRAPTLSAKIFRTWAGTVRALAALREVPAEAATKAALVEVVKEVAEQLGQHAGGVPQVLHPPGRHRLLRTGRAPRAGRTPRAPRPRRRGDCRRTSGSCSPSSPRSSGGSRRHSSRRSGARSRRRARPASACGRTRGARSRCGSLLRA